MLTTSGSTALDMAALLCGIKPGDEVILPSFTFSSTANSFVLAGATLVFVDIRPDTMNIDETKIEAAITEKTKVIGSIADAEVLLGSSRKGNKMISVIVPAYNAAGTIKHCLSTLRETNIKTDREFCITICLFMWENGCILFSV